MADSEGKSNPPTGHSTGESAGAEGRKPMSQPRAYALVDALSRWGSIVAIVASGVAAAQFIGALARPPQDARTDIAAVQRETSIQLDSLSKVVESSRADNRSLEMMLDSLAAVSPNAIVRAELVATSVKLEDIDHRLSALEGALEHDPAKALAVPLLRKDVEALSVEEHNDIATVTASVDRIYDLSKWLLGSLTLGLFSLAFANIFRWLLDRRTARLPGSGGS